MTLRRRRNAIAAVDKADFARLSNARDAQFQPAHSVGFGLLFAAAATLGRRQGRHFIGAGFARLPFGLAKVSDLIDPFL